MKEVKSVKDSKKIIIEKSGVEGISLTLYDKDCMGKEIFIGKIIVDYEHFKCCFKEELK